MGSLDTFPGTVMHRPPVQVHDGLAHWRGSTEVPLMKENIAQMAARGAKLWPSKVAIEACGRTLTYQELDEQSDVLAQALARLGHAFGDRLVISLNNCIEYILLFVACGKLGVITVVLNPANSPGQTIAAVQHVSAKSIILGTVIEPPYREPRSNSAHFEKLIEAATSMPSLQHVFKIGDFLEDFVHGASTVKDFSDLFNPCDTAKNSFSLPEHISCDTILNLQFTSGTTAAPKAVSLTHKNVLNNARQIGWQMGFTPSDVICCPFPMFHCSGLVVGFLASFVHGATIIYPSSSFHPGRVLETINRHHPTILHGVPTMFEALMDLIRSRGEKFENHSIRTGLIGASMSSPDLRRRVQDELHIKGLLSAYGMTELSPMTSSTNHTDSMEHQLHTVGHPVPHSSIKICMPENPDVTVKTGQRGEILASGYHVMNGYWNNAEKTAEAFRGSIEHVKGVGDDETGEKLVVRWLRTGDEGMIDAEGRLSITGRIKDVIIRGGENIYPHELEHCLASLPGLEAVSVVGMPDAKMGEVVAAFVKVSPRAQIVSEEGVVDVADLRAGVVDSGREEVTSGPLREYECSVTATSVRQHVQDRLAKHQVPKYVFWVARMPLTASGKVEKHTLRKWGEQKLNEALYVVDD